MKMLIKVLFYVTCFFLLCESHIAIVDENVEGLKFDNFDEAKSRFKRDDDSDQGENEEEESEGEGPTISNFDFCEATTISGYAFPQTEANTIAFSTQSCISGLPEASVLCTRDMGINPPEFMFEEPEIRNCSSSLRDIFSELQDDEALIENFDFLLPQIHLLTSRRRGGSNPANSSNTVIYDGSKIINIMRRICTLAEEDMFQILASRTLPYVISTLSQLSEALEGERKNAINNDAMNISRLQQESARIIPSMCILSQFDEGQRRWQIETDALQMEAEDFYQNQNVTHEVEILQDNGTSTPAVSLTVPASVFARARGAFSNEEPNRPENTSVRTVFIYYKTSDLFPSNDTARNILSLDVGTNESLTANLTNPVRIRHMNLVEKQGRIPVWENDLLAIETTFQCVFWDFNTSSWSGDGCELVEVDGTPECQCSHLTNFALLINTRVVRQDFALEIVTMVGAGISICGLLITITMFSLQRDLRKNRPGKILLHLCCNLMISYLIFLAGIDIAAANPAACTAVTFLLHYFILVSWSWMGVYSYEIYMALVKVFQTHQSRFMVKTSIACYLGALVIVSLTFGLTVGLSPATEDGMLNLSSYFLENVCWLKDRAWYYGFLLPVGIILVGNFIVFFLVTYELNKQSKAKAKPRVSCKDSCFIAITMTFVMGLTWIFGYLQLITVNETFFTVMSWLFGIFSTFQGFAIFLLTVVRHKDSRRFICKPFRGIFGSHKKRFLQTGSNSVPLSRTSTRSDRNSNSSLKCNTSRLTKSETVSSDTP